MTVSALELMDLDLGGAHLGRESTKLRWLFYGAFKISNSHTGGSFDREEEEELMVFEESGRAMQADWSEDDSSF